VLTYFGLRNDDPPNATLFEMFCIGWNLGRRKPKTRRHTSRKENPAP